MEKLNLKILQFLIYMPDYLIKYIYIYRNLLNVIVILISSVLSYNIRDIKKDFKEVNYF